MSIRPSVETERSTSKSDSSRGLGASIAIFEPGFLQVVLAYAREGALPPGTLVKFYFAGGGYLGGGEPLWGAPPILEALDLYLAMLDQLKPSDIQELQSKGKVLPPLVYDTDETTGTRDGKTIIRADFFTDQVSDVL